jgi:hypothetical protein
MKDYILVEHDHLKKESKIVNTYNCKYDALEIMVEMAEYYIKCKVGVTNIIYYKKGDKNRIYNYFIENDAQDNNNKLTVKRKYVKYGFLWLFSNTVLIEDIISYYIITRKSYTSDDDFLDFYKDEDGKFLYDTSNVDAFTFFLSTKHNDIFNDYNVCMQDLINKIKKEEDKVVPN